MNRFTVLQQSEIIKARGRRSRLDKLLNSFDWKTAGYADHFAWLRDLYGPGRSDDLLLMCQRQFEAEDLL